MNVDGGWALEMLGDFGGIGCVVLGQMTDSDEILQQLSRDRCSLYCWHHCDNLKSRTPAFWAVWQLLLVVVEGVKV